MSKLTARWSKRLKDIVYNGSNHPDMRLIYNQFEKDWFLEELRRRGYDLSTLKFSIAPVAQLDGAAVS